jgi:hypothetical protein
MLYRFLLSLTLILTSAAVAEEGAKVVQYYGYDDCIELTNDLTRVVLCPAAGGRVLEYALDGKNALYLPPGDEGYRWEPGSKKRGSMMAGRFDIGPEQLVPRRDAIWKGTWSGKITGPRSARLTSVKDEATGVQLTRDFSLSAASSGLKVTQTITNVSDEPKEYCHWSRTFAIGGGTVLVPTSKRSRFPKHYVMYESGKTMNFRPEDPQIQLEDKSRLLRINAAPKHPKLGMDSQAGWFAYLMPHDVMFVKTFKVSPERHYNEVAGLTVSIWYPDNGNMVELEPIGPAEQLQPGESGSFTETWHLLPQKFVKPDEPVSYDDLAKKVHAAASSEQ